MLIGKYRQFYHGDWEDEDGYNIADQQSLQSSFDGDHGESTITYHVSWENVKDFVDNLLGFAEVDASQPGGIAREIPQRHPFYPSLWCMHVSVNPIGVDPDTRDNDEGNTFTNSYGTCSIPELAEVVAVFRDPPYRIRTDDTIESEIHRNVIRETDYNVNYVSGGTNKLKCVIDNNYISDSAPPGTQAVFQKVLTWVDVPTSQDDPYYPDNWLGVRECIGKLNAEPFDGHPAGTVRLINAKYTQKQPNSLNNRWYFDWKYTLEVIDVHDTIGGVQYGGLNYWDGTKNIGGTINEDQDPTDPNDWVNWNCFYLPNSTTFAPHFTLFTWNGVRTGEPYFKYADFDKLFSILPS